MGANYPDSASISVPSAFAGVKVVADFFTLVNFDPVADAVRDADFDNAGTPELFTQLFATVVYDMQQQQFLAANYATDGLTTYLIHNAPIANWEEMLRVFGYVLEGADINSIPEAIVDALTITVPVEWFEIDCDQALSDEVSRAFGTFLLKLVAHIVNFPVSSTVSEVSTELSSSTFSEVSTEPGSSTFSKVTS